MSADFLTGSEYLHAGDIVQLDCDTQCNFILLDAANFRAYQRGDSFRHSGGFFTHFPAQIVVPTTGTWNWVIDLGGGQANIRHSVSYIKQQR